MNDLHNRIACDLSDYRSAEQQTSGYHALRIRQHAMQRVVVNLQHKARLTAKLEQCDDEQTVIRHNLKRCILDILQINEALLLINVMADKVFNGCPGEVYCTERCNQLIAEVEDIHTTLGVDDITLENAVQEQQRIQVSIDESEIY